MTENVTVAANDVGTIDAAVLSKPRAKAVPNDVFLAKVAEVNPEGKLFKDDVRKLFKNEDGSIMEPGTFEGKLTQCRAIGKALHKENPKDYPTEIPVFLTFSHKSGGGNGRKKGEKNRNALAAIWKGRTETVQK